MISEANIRAEWDILRECAKGNWRLWMEHQIFPELKKMGIEHVSTQSQENPVLMYTWVCKKDDLNIEIYASTAFAFAVRMFKAGHLKVWPDQTELQGNAQNYTVRHLLEWLQTALKE